MGGPRDSFDERSGEEKNLRNHKATNCKKENTNCNKSAWAASRQRCSGARSKQVSKQGAASEERQVRGYRVNANRKAGGD